MGVSERSFQVAGMTIRLMTGVGLLALLALLAACGDKEVILSGEH